MMMGVLLMVMVTMMIVMEMRGMMMGLEMRGMVLMGLVMTMG